MLILGISRWQDWLMQFQAIGFALMLIVLCLALLVLWNDVRRLRLGYGQVHALAQKARHELAQQRYVIASLREAMLQPDVEVAEQDLFKTALAQLDTLLQSLPAEQKRNDTNGKSVDELKEREILTFIKMALRNNQIALASQPIKGLPGGQTRFHEFYSRIKIGDQYVPANKFMSVARNNGLMALVDQTFLLRTLQLVRHKADDDAFVAYFCNVSASSFANPQFLQAIIQYLQSQPRLAARLVFEMSQEDTFLLDDASKSIFTQLVELGCRFSMDNVRMMGLDVDRLRQLHLSFVKFNVDAVLQEVENPAGRRRWTRTRNWLADHGIEIIVEKVENARQMDKLLDSGFAYAQGYHFGRPDIVS